MLWLSAEFWNSGPHGILSGCDSHRFQVTAIRQHSAIEMKRGRKSACDVAPLALCAAGAMVSSNARFPSLLGGASDDDFDTLVNCN
jgi:hypothetical protein